MIHRRNTQKQPCIWLQAIDEHRALGHAPKAIWKPIFGLFYCRFFQTVLARPILKNWITKPLPHRQTIATVLSVLVTLLLGISALRYVTDIWIFSFFYSFQTHFGILCAAGAIVIWLIHRNWYAIFLLALSCFIVGHSVVLKREFFRDFPANAATSKSYRLISFNILGDNWENGENIKDMIIGSGADVAYILEAPPLQPFLAELDTRYPYRLGCGNGTPTCDLMILSKRPFVSRIVRSLSELRQDRFMMVDIDLDGQMTHFAAAHLSKPYFDMYHQEELYTLRKSLPEDKYPLILAGDFNASILEPDMAHFLRKTGLMTGPLEPKTWPIKAGQFGISIDHVFSRAPLYLKAVENTPSNYGSNHNGLMADFILAK